MKIKPFEEKIWLSTPTMHGDEMKYIAAAFESNWVSTEGANLAELERLVCGKTGCKHAVPLSSGTAALHLAVKLAGIGQGDTVFCSDMTFAATINAISYEKAVPVLIDSEYDTWNMDPAALEKAFEMYPDTKAVMVVDLYGTPAKYDEICSIARKHGAVIIEDAAEAFGSVYKGKQVGTFGAYNAVSFNGNKIITGSSGGMLLTDEPEAAYRAQKWSTQSRESAPWYQHMENGYNYRMSNLIAGLICGQMPYLEEHIARKRAIYERYRKGFRDLPVTMNPYDAETMQPNFWLSCMLIDESAMCRQERTDRETFYASQPGKTCPDEILETLAEYHVYGRHIWKPMHMQPLCAANSFVTKEDNKRSGSLDVGADLFRRGLCLPSDIKMTPETQDAIIQIIRQCFE